MYEELIRSCRACATGYVGNCDSCMFSGEDCYKQLHKASADAIEELTNRNVGKWIPVTERLPEEYTSILFVSGSGQVHVGYYDSEHKSLCDMTGFRYVCTHWMPLPQPPKEKYDV